MIVWIVLLWLLCGIINYGMMFAYWQRNFPAGAEKEYSKDMFREIVISLFGPIALLSGSVFLLSNPKWYGFKFK
jgi:hypothetical protein